MVQSIVLSANDSPPMFLIGGLRIRASYQSLACDVNFPCWLTEEGWVIQSIVLSANESAPLFLPQQHYFQV